MEGIDSGSAASKLRSVGADLGEFAGANGRYPQSLVEFAEWDKQKNRPRIVKDSGKLAFEAPYNKTFQYEATDRTYRIYTIGPDGELGGLKLSGDLDQRPNGHVTNETTFNEFFYESPFRFVLFWSNVGVSVFTGLLWFFLPQRLSKSAISVLVIALSFVVLINLPLFIIETISNINWVSSCILGSWCILFAIAKRMDANRCLFCAVTLTIIVIIGYAIYPEYFLESVLICPAGLWILCLLLARRPDVRQNRRLVVQVSIVMMTVFATVGSAFFFLCIAGMARG
jgi:hypothetical protein